MLAAITTLTPLKTKISKITVQIIPTVEGSLYPIPKNLLAVLEVIFQNSYYSLIELISSLANCSGVLIIGTYMGSLSTLIANLK